MKALQDGDPLRVGPYEVLGVLGSGGMGRVYLGRRDDVVVAVKVINEELTQDAGFIARFRREVTATRAVSGPYVAAVVDHDVDGEQPWLATEYVPGPSLHEVITEHGALGTVPVRALGVRLAEALGAIHAAGLVHRDVKPGNILLGPDGPKLIDFGIARGEAVTTLTQTGVVLGTPQFMAPEQLQARGRVGPAADVFALGLVLAFAATGKHPFGRTDSFGFGFRIVYEEPDLDDVPAELVDLVRRCLAKDPDERPTPEELATALDSGDATVDRTGLADLVRHASDSAIPLPPPRTEPNSPTRPPRRRPALVGLAAAVVLGVVVTVVVALAPGTPADTLGQGPPSGGPTGSSTTGAPTASATSAAPSSSPPGGPGSTPPPSPPPSSAAPSTANAAPSTEPPGGGNGGSGSGGSSAGTSGTSGTKSTGGGSTGGSSHAPGGTSGGAAGGTGGGSPSTPTPVRTPTPTPPAPLPSPSPSPSPKGAPPSAMTSFNARFNNSCIGSCYMPLTLFWSAEPDATRYDIQYTNQTTHVSAVYSTANTTYTINGPISGDRICVALRAANQYGPSAWTETYCVDTPY
ncbi:serine/threonine-protein kinase [Kitasatospora sp. McL0602]|uniref:serine/threonine-protein kinase n=1 Tax=Kitasatospora sp. McL0602 TaxID=3439530 RepID=UPI003F8CD92B